MCDDGKGLAQVSVHCIELDLHNNLARVASSKQALEAGTPILDAIKRRLLYLELPLTQPTVHIL